MAKKEQLNLEINHQEKTVIHSLGDRLEDMKIDYVLINKLVKEVVVKNTGKRRYGLLIHYGFNKM